MASYTCFRAGALPLLRILRTGAGVRVRVRVAVGAAVRPEESGRKRAESSSSCRWSASVPPPPTLLAAAAQRSRPSLAFGCCERLARGECDRRSSPRLGPTRRWSHGRASRGRQPGAYGVYPARRAVAQHTNSRVAFAALRGSNNYIFRQVARTPVPSAGH